MSGGIVSVFGSSRPKPGTAPYEEARAMGRLLGEAGYTVATGGYVGTMAGTSQGAAEAGAHVIGVTSAIFDGKGEGREGPNPWVKEEIKLPTLRERLFHLVTFCDAAISLRGGIGTLSEVALMWSLLQTGEVTPRPFVLVGKSWQAWLEDFYGQGEYIEAANMKLWQCVETPEDALRALKGGV